MTKQNVTPIFCIDTTYDKKNQVINGAEFITRTTSKQQLEAYEKKKEDVEQIIEKSKLPKVLSIIRYVLGFLFIVIFGGLIKASFETELSKLIDNGKVLIIVGAICGVICLILTLYAKKKWKVVLEEENFDAKVKEVDLKLNYVQYDLEIPTNAHNVDILMFKYKMKNGKPIPKAYGLQLTKFFNFAVKIFETNNTLNIADIEKVYTFYKEDIKAITKVDKSMVVPGWNKVESIKDEKYKEYKLKGTNIGIAFKTYYILEIEKDGKCYGIYFPCYEIETFERLTGLKSELSV